MKQAREGTHSFCMSSVSTAGAIVHVSTPSYILYLKSWQSVGKSSQITSKAAFVGYHSLLVMHSSRLLATVCVSQHGSFTTKYCCICCKLQFAATRHDWHKFVVGAGGGGPTPAAQGPREARL